MTNCACPVAGYCERHQVSKSEHWHDLCQLREDYFDTWEKGRGPGQVRIVNERIDQHKKRVEEAIRRKKQLISWLKMFRMQSEKGIGDTASRLVKQKKKSPIWVAADAHDAIKRLLAQCSCSRTEAVARLNQEWPY